MASNKVIQTVLRLKDNFSKPLRQAKETVKEFTSGAKKSQEQFAKIVKKTENSITKDLKRIKNNFKQLARDITKSLASISYRGLQKGMDMLKKFSFLGGTLGVASLGAGIFEGMDYETYKVQLETATKDTKKASQLMRDAIAFANKTPFETGTVIEATAKFESMGLSATKWLSITSDMAGATSKDMIQAVEAVIDAVASGEFERLKEFGLSKKTLEDLDVSGKVFNNKGQVIDQLALTELLFNEMEKRYKGGAESLSKTTKGMWSTVTGVFKNSMAKIVGVTDDGMVRSGSLLDSFRGVIEKVANKMVKWQQDGTIEKISAKFDRFLARAKVIFGYIGNLIDIVKQKFVQWQADGTIDNLKEKLGNIFKNVIDFIPVAINFVLGFIDNLRWILPIIAGVVAGVKTWGIVSNITAIATDLLAKKQAILNIAAKLFNKTAWSNPYVLVIGLIIGAIALLILNFDKIKDKCLEWWDIIKEKYPNVAKMFIFIANTIKIVFNAIWKVIKILVTTIINRIESIIGTIQAIISNVFNIVVGLIDMVLYQINTVVEGIKNIFGGIIDFFTGVFTGNWEQALNGLKSIAEGIFNIIKGIFLAPFTLFSKGINWVIEKINGLKINIPDWVPIIGGNSYSFNIPTIPEGLPNYATGTSYHRGGPAIINECGRGEIVDLPNGSKVIPHDKSKKLLDKNNSPINVTINVYNPNDVDEIINEFAYKLMLFMNNS
ncbi:hypothetical protein [uncultured Tyzzerella sp.]|uniref:hypothetical protein n=1 Tax=uncultured Tyzzerella sp. TaxID=2321398 RepID=UPI002943B395|nr:hypothetical protein [uncultured Tyzzerella sp.]